MAKSSLVALSAALWLTLAPRSAAAQEPGVPHPPYALYPYPYPYPYVQPSPPPEPRAPKAPPSTLAYEEGQPIPQGYRLEESIRPAPTIVGASLFGSAYILGLSIAAGTGFDNQSGWLALPVAGPFVTLALREQEECDSTDGLACGWGDAYAGVGLVMSGAMQIAGATLLIIGLQPRKQLVRVGKTEIYLSPIAAPQLQGIRVGGAF